MDVLQQALHQITAAAQIFYKAYILIFPPDQTAGLNEPHCNSGRALSSY